MANVKGGRAQELFYSLRVGGFVFDQQYSNGARCHGSCLIRYRQLVERINRAWPPAVIVDFRVCPSKTPAEVMGARESLGVNLLQLIRRLAAIFYCRFFG